MLSNLIFTSYVATDKIFFIGDSDDEMDGGAINTSHVNVNATDPGWYSHTSVDPGEFFGIGPMELDEPKPRSASAVADTISPDYSPVDPKQCRLRSTSDPRPVEFKKARLSVAQQKFFDKLLALETSRSYITKENFFTVLQETITDENPKNITMHLNDMRSAVRHAYSNVDTAFTFCLLNWVSDFALKARKS